MASVSLKRSTDVRWLSLINSLQSLARAYKSTKKVLHKHDRLIFIDSDDLAWLIRLLLPFKVIIEKIQTGNSPSLHYVLLSYMTIRRVLSSTEELQRFNTEFAGENMSTHVTIDEDGDDDLNIEVEPLGKTFFYLRLFIFYTIL
jgi:hypothetical protein